MDGKRKILILSLGADLFIKPGTTIVGGQAVFGRNLAEQLSQLYDVAVVSLFFSSLRQESRSEKYQIFDIPLPGYNHDAFSIWEYSSYINRVCMEKIKNLDLKDYTIVSIYWNSGYFLTQNPQIQFNLWIHTFSSFASLKAHQVDYKSKVKYINFRENIEALIADKATYIWATCGFEVQYLLKTFNTSQEKILLLPRVVDRNLFRPFGRKPHNFRWDILFIGRLDYRKGIYDIPEILGKTKTHKIYNIAIVGGSQQELKAYKSWVEKNYREILKRHNIQFLPAVNHSDIPDYLNSSRLLLMPSQYEVFGNAALEALACGVPVIATSVGGLPELIKQDVNGHIFEYGDYCQAALYIDRLLTCTEEYERIKKNTVEHFTTQNKYTWGNLIERLQEII